MAEIKSKKKTFVKILAPKQFNNQVIGESLVLDPRVLLERKIKMNMMSLTNDPKNQNVQVKFKIVALKGDAVETEIIGYRLLPAFVKRLVRKDKRRVDDCFILKTKDDKVVVAKMFLLTLNGTSKSIAKNLRRTVMNSLALKVSKLSFEAFMGELVGHRIQNSLRGELAKVYPLKQCEIRSLEVIEGKKAEKAKIVVVKEEKKVEVAKEEKKEEVKEVKAEEKPAEEVKKEEVKPEVKKEE
jgi:ribosomal protein S3AE